MLAFTKVQRLAGYALTAAGLAVACVYGIAGRELAALTLLIVSALLLCATLGVRSLIASLQARNPQAVFSDDATGSVRLSRIFFSIGAVIAILGAVFESAPGFRWLLVACALVEAILVVALPTLIRGRKGSGPSDSANEQVSRAATRRPYRSTAGAFILGGVFALISLASGVLFSRDVQGSTSSFISLDLIGFVVAGAAAVFVFVTTALQRHRERAEAPDDV